MQMHNNNNNKEEDKNFPYPNDWQNNERMAVLFAPFRLRSLNEENYDAKMNFWLNFIASYCMHNCLASFSMRELQQKFTRKQQQPQCLAEVLQMMLQKRLLRSRSEYMADPLNGWSTWALNSLFKRPLSWSYHQLKKAIWLARADDWMDVQYVHLETLQKLCELLSTKVLAAQQSKVLSYKELNALLVDVPDLAHFKDNSLQICLHTLHCKREIGLEYQQCEIKLIKIPMHNKPETLAITQLDRESHELHMVKQRLEQLNVIEELKTITSEVAQHLKANKRHLAKSYLRKQKLLEKKQEKIDLALHNIETLIHSIEEAQNQGLILNAYQIGTKALKTVHNSSGLKYENVDDIICEMRETLETHREMADSIANGTANIVGLVDDAELERELNAIQAQEETIKPKEQIIATETTDAELLAMLEELEVADDKLTSIEQSKQQKEISI